MEILNIFEEVLFEGDGSFAALVETNKINLQEANLWHENLQKVNLYGANLQGANLRWANLQGTNLQEANLQGADLQGANLQGANLQGADLWRANLQEANLQGADLQDTVLDPSNIPNMGGSDLFEERSEGGLLGYRTRISTHVGSQEYKGGETYKAPWFSTSDNECHPGLYIFPTRKQTEKWEEIASIVKVTFKEEDLHQAGNKWRVRSLTVLENV